MATLKELKGLNSSRNGKAEDSNPSIPTGLEKRRIESDESRRRDPVSIFRWLLLLRAVIILACRRADCIENGAIHI